MIILLYPFVTDSIEEPIETNPSCGVTVVHCEEIQEHHRVPEIHQTPDSLQALENIEYSVINESNLLQNIPEKENNDDDCTNEIASESSSTSEDYVPEEESESTSDDNQDEHDESNLVKIPSLPSTSSKGLVPEVMKRIRKRKAEPDIWKRNERKIKRMSGKSYQTRKHIIMPEKKPSYINCSRCRFKCSDKISLERQQILHQEYWGLADADRQKAFLCSLVTENSIQRHRKRNPESKITKTKSRVYSLYDEKGCNVRVCLKFLCATFSISFQIIDLALKKRGPGGAYIGTDGRKGKCPANVTPKEATNHVKKHIDSFPRMESHYSRRDTKKLYLSADLNLSVMYRLYVESYCTNEKITPVSISVYRKIFNSYEPQLSFHIPKKDQCSTCNLYYSATDKTDLEESWQLHKKKEKEAMEMKEADKKRSSEDPTYRAISFDLEAILSVPFSADCQIYYKRKLSVFNFTIFDSFDHSGHCFVWDETHGSKGASEIGTCLLKYLHSLPHTVSHVSSFSDTCGGQNRNQFVTAAMLYAVNKIEHLQIVDLKFMESGHSYLEADSIHATIERARKHRKIFTTEEWGLLIEMARKKPCPYQVNKLFFPEFFDLQELASLIMQNTKVNTLQEQVKWLHIKWLRFDKAKPFIVQYKYSLADNEFLEFDVLQVKKIKKNSWKTVALSQKYGQRLPISEAKKKDLLYLLDKQIIPRAYKSYFESLPSSKKAKDVVPYTTPHVTEEEV